MAMVEVRMVNWMFRDVRYQRTTTLAQTAITHSTIPGSRSAATSHGHGSVEEDYASYAFCHPENRRP
jgi:hypothetical protein